ncbi:hypothetical protein [Saccharothrix deserti]|uniref:hypothetical protein n=1 Tax=Saccharothrix deserti TaxID=2593674 RepID=UPI00131C452C|nr:hypothetical protein [Saccharothrix deserti]
MSEADLRERLRAAVGDEPPLNFDPDDLIRRAKHARKRRRALVAVALATFAITGTVLSLPGAFDRRQGIDVAKEQVLTTTASPSPALTTQALAPTPATSPDSSPTSEPPPPVIEQVPGAPAALPEGTTTALAAYLTKRFAEVVPDAKVLTAEYPGQNRAGYLTVVVRFHDGVGTSAVEVRLSTTPSRTTRDQFCAAVECAEPRQQADGSYLQFAVVTDSASVAHTVAHFRADGSVVQVSGYNYDPTKGDEVRTAVAVTVDQLERLATDPKLALG